MRAAALFLLLLLAPASAGESLVSGLSQDNIEIRSNYNGTEITVFGAVEQPVSDKRADIVVVLRGPSGDLRVRRKDRVAGIWINRNRVVLHGMPGYYFVASSRPLAEIARDGVLGQYGLGLAAVRPKAVTGEHALAPFLDAAIRIERQAGLYRQDDGAVEFLSGTLFRARVSLPASAPRGRYTAYVYLLRDGQVIDARTSELSIAQTGLERRIYDFSQDQPLSYGISVVLMAMAFGWLSSLVFRKS